jgi:hypothetical protein
MRGAWQWPAFGLLTVADAIVLNALPVWGDGPGGLVPGLLLAGALNLMVVALAAPLAGLLLRRRRRDLPRAIASDYAGAVLLGLLFAGLVAGGLSHRPALARDRHDRAVVGLEVARFVTDHRPEYRAGMAQMDTMRLEAGMYRSCVPGPDPIRPLCVIVRTDRTPPTVTEDLDRASNAVYRSHGGFE